MPGVYILYDRYSLLGHFVSGICGWHIVIVASCFALTTFIFDVLPGLFANVSFRCQLVATFENVWFVLTVRRFYCVLEL